MLEGSIQEGEDNFLTLLERVVTEFKVNKRIYKVLEDSGQEGERRRLLNAVNYKRRIKDYR